MRGFLAVVTMIGGLAAVATLGWSDVSSAQQAQGAGDEALLSSARSQAELARTQRAAREAAARAKTLGSEAEAAKEAVDKTQRQAVALAASIQQAEAAITAGEARLVVVRQERGTLDARLAAREQPLVRLAAALQTLSRRPLALSALQPASLRETVYLRAVLASTLPQIRAQTADLRGALDQRRAFEDEAKLALDLLRNSEQQLAMHRRELSALEGRQRIALQGASETASRERARALALAENARDLDALVDELDRAGTLRQELAALPGPIARPTRPGDAQLAAAARPSAGATGGALPLRLRPPVEGRTLAGFGEVGAGGLRSRGGSLAPRAAAQVVAPAAGRVAYAGPYRGFGRIVIIEHGNGWTSLVTGLARSTVDVGSSLVAGSPLGIAPSKDPVITLELRRLGVPINPLQYM